MCSPVIQLSMMSEAESTFDVRGYRSYFNSQVRDWSKKLPCPTVTNSVASHTSCSNSFSPCKGRDSWFSIKTTSYPWKTISPTISWLSTPSTSAECKEGEPLQTVDKDNKTCQETSKHEPHLITRKINVKYNWKQKTLLKQWIGSCRLIYNTVTAHFKESKVLWSLQRYRKVIRKLEEDKTFLKDVPYNSKDESIKEAMSNIKTILSLRKKENGVKHSKAVPFRCRKKATQILPVRSQNIKDYKIYPRLLFNKENGQSNRYVERNVRRRFEGEPQIRDSHLLWNRKLDKWYLCLVTDVTGMMRMCREHQATDKSISIDPGNRTFATWYSPTEGTGKIGDGDGKRLVKMCLWMDKVLSQSTHVNHSKRQKLLRFISRSRERLVNVRNDLHNKLASWLTRSFDTIIIPKFNTHLMSKRGNRRIGRKTVRGLMTWGHGMFREKLRQMCERHGNTLLHPSEAYTSKTCSLCGWIDEKLGGKKIFTCRNCKLVICRDENGARGIMLRAMLGGACVV